MRSPGSQRRQRGVSSVEMAIGGTVFFVILFAVIEVGRLLFTWNTLNEVTRRAARLAAVCAVTEVASIQTAVTAAGTLVHGLAPTDVTIVYLDANGAVVGDPVANFTAIHFVRAAVSDSFEYALLIPLHTTTLVPRAFSTTVVAESLGVVPFGTGVAPPC